MVSKEGNINTIDCQTLWSNSFPIIYQVLEKAARTKRKSRRKHRRRRPHKKPVEVKARDGSKDQIFQVNVQVSNFIEEPEEVIYYEESFPGEFDDGVVVDYEETSAFDEQVQGSFYGHLSFSPHFIELLLVIGETRFQADHPGVYLRKILRR